MAYNIEGETCPVCKAYLFNDDDVVFCPVCGAPHHRDCYASIGHCGMEEFHGTENQYAPKSSNEEPQKPENTEGRVTSLCPRCGRESEGQALFCPYCGCDMSGKAGTQANPVYAGMYIDPYGGLPRDGSVKIEGEKLDDVKKFVYSNTQRYLPLFSRLSRKNKTNWNWAAFILPHCWLFFRKQYTAGLVAAVLILAASLCSIPLSSELSALTSGVVMENNSQAVQQILAYLPQASSFAIIMYVLGGILELGVMIFFGLFGDWFYRGHTVAKIREINSNDEIAEKDEALMSKGGISVWAYMIAYAVVLYAPQVIASFI